MIRPRKFENISELNLKNVSFLQKLFEEILLRSWNKFTFRAAVIGKPKKSIGLPKFDVLDNIVSFLKTLPATLQKKKET